MRVVQSSGYVQWRARTIADPECGEQARIDILSMEGILRQLAGPPEEETATLKRVRQARRHPLWRVRHPYRERLALRIVCYFPDEQTVVLALLGFNKHPIGDVWYDRASQEAELLVDEYLRKRERGEAP